MDRSQRRQQKTPTTAEAEAKRKEEAESYVTQQSIRQMPRRKNQRQSTILARRQRRKWQTALPFQIIEWERRWQQKGKSDLSLVKRDIEATFVFVTDYTKSTRHNASILLAMMPMWL
jgi:hypothetical protein